MQKNIYLFIGYCDRSGSTFLLNELNKIEGVVVCPEFDLLIRLLLKKPYKKVSTKFLGKFINTCINNINYKIWDTLPERTEYSNRIELFFAILHRYANKINPNPTCIVFKERSILEYHYILTQYSEKVNFLSLIRDPRAVFASQSRTKKPVTNRLMSSNPVSTSRSWNKHCRISNELQNETNTKILYYESLIKEPNITIQHLYKWITNSDKKLETKNEDSKKPFYVNYNNMHSIVNQPAKLERIDAWQSVLKKSEIYIIEKTSRKFLVQHSYPINDIQHTWKLRTIHCIMFIISIYTIAYWWSTVIRRKIVFIGFTKSQ
ncbi:MAG: sulfotransferase [Bacteroidales bacterium]|nr:sulfotransferase [Bacteroidales bacterium]